MGYCRVCDYCGANLDPGEACDCVEARARRELPPRSNRTIPPTGDRRGGHFFQREVARRGVWYYLRKDAKILNFLPFLLKKLTGPKMRPFGI